MPKAKEKALIRFVQVRQTLNKVDRPWIPDLENRVKSISQNREERGINERIQRESL